MDAPQGTQGLGAPDSDVWQGVDGGMEDPEEARVIYCSLDSFS